MGSRPLFERGHPLLGRLSFIWKVVLYRAVVLYLGGRPLLGRLSFTWEGWPLSERLSFIWKVVLYLKGHPLYCLLFRDFSPGVVVI